MESSFPPSPCPFCQHSRLLNRQHYSYCPSRADNMAPTEVYPNLYVGPVDYRGSDRYAAVVSILTREERAYFEALAPPRWPNVLIDHRDRTPGLLGKGEEAWMFMDQYLERGKSVLVHCAVGSSRSPTIAAGWLLTRKRIPLRTLLEEYLLKRPPVMNLSAILLQELVLLEEATLGTNSVNLDGRFLS